MEDAEEFSNAILEAKKQVHTCPVCQNLTDREVCPICDDDTRDKSVICVVSRAEGRHCHGRNREFRGVYHVLHGVISPLNHVSQDDIRIKGASPPGSRGEGSERCIMATNPDTEEKHGHIHIPPAETHGGQGDPACLRRARWAASWNMPTGDPFQSLGRPSGDVKRKKCGAASGSPTILRLFRPFSQKSQREAEKEPHRRTPDPSPAVPKASWSGEGSTSRPERQRRIQTHN